MLTLKNSEGLFQHVGITSVSADNKNIITAKSTYPVYFTTQALGHQASVYVEPCPINAPDLDLTLTLTLKLAFERV